MSIQWIHALAFAAALAAPSAQEAGVSWESDLSAARTLAASAGKPLFVVFRCER